MPLPYTAVTLHGVLPFVVPSPRRYTTTSLQLHTAAGRKTDFVPVPGSCSTSEPQGPCAAFVYCGDRARSSHLSSHCHTSTCRLHISTSDATSILLCFCAATPSCLRLTTLPPCHVFTSLHRRLLLTFPLHSLHSTPSTRHMVFTFYGKIIYSLHFIDLFYRLYPPAPIR